MSELLPLEKHIYIYIYTYILIRNHSYKKNSEHNSKWLNAGLQLGLLQDRKHYYTEKLEWPEPNLIAPQETFVIFMQGKNTFLTIM